MIVLKNATLVHLHPAEVIPGVDVVIEGTEIQAVGRAAAEGLKPEQDPRPGGTHRHAGPRVQS